MVHTKADSKFEATLLGPPDLKIPSPNMDNYGDPLAKLMNDSGGPGGRQRHWQRHRNRHWQR